MALLEGDLAEEDSIQPSLRPADTNIGLKRTQSIAFLHQRGYGRFLDHNLSCSDPFYALSDLLAFCASSKSQLMNLIWHQLEIKSVDYEDEEDVQRWLSNIQDMRLLLLGQCRQLKRIIHKISERGGHKWNKISCLEVESEKREVAINKLQNDYKDLLQRVQELSEFCREEVDILVRNTQLLAAERAIDQAKRMGTLTLLAFFFLPLSLTTPFFGMNFKELNSKLEIWIFFAASAGVFLFSLLLCFWNKTVSKVYRWYKRKKRDRNTKKTLAEA